MEIIKKLIDGNKQFKEKFFNQNPELFDELLQGQRPEVMVIACCDSRVDPAIVFGCQPGDLFVVRNVANLVPPCENNDGYHGTSAALEFAVKFLEVKHIIVLGHTRCGGIQALLQHAEQLGDNKKSFIAKWMELARPAYDKVVAEHRNVSFDEKVVLCEQYALVHSLHNLQTFGWIADRVNAGTLKLHAWLFDLATGDVCRYDQDNKQW